MKRREFIKLVGASTAGIAAGCIDFSPPRNPPPPEPKELPWDEKFRIAMQAMMRTNLSSVQLEGKTYPSGTVVVMKVEGGSRRQVVVTVQIRTSRIEWLEADNAITPIEIYGSSPAVDQLLSCADRILIEPEPPFFISYGS